MTPIQRPVRTVLLGWATFVLTTALVVVVRGLDYAPNMAVFAALGAAMLAWVALRRSRASLVVSLVLGVLHTIEQVAYLAAGVTSDDTAAGVLVADAVGLASGVLLVVGSSQGLRRGAQIDHALPVQHV